MNPDGGAFLHGSKVKTDASTWTVEVGTASLMDTALSFSLPAARDNSGFAPHRADANFHRFRVNIPSQTGATCTRSCHG